MNNKVKFLRGTSNEYAVAEKDSDTIYFTTDDGRLYIGDKEVSGGGSYKLPIATTEILGGVMPDGTTITVDENGVISGSSNSFGTVGSNVKPVYFSNGVPKECAYTTHQGSVTISTGGTGRYDIKHNQNFYTAPAVFLQINIPNVVTYSSEYGVHMYANETKQFSFAYNLPANSTVYYFLIGFSS